VEYSGTQIQFKSKDEVKVFGIKRTNQTGKLLNII